MTTAKWRETTCRIQCTLKWNYLLDKLPPERDSHDESLAANARDQYGHRTVLLKPFPHLPATLQGFDLTHFLYYKLDFNLIITDTNLLSIADFAVESLDFAQLRCCSTSIFS